MVGNSHARPAKRMRRVAGEMTVEIPLRPTYRRGTHPPPGRISLLPEHFENTAYIVQKTIYPSGRYIPDYVQRRPLYIIGWTDLCQARIAVDCSRAYDYVSPRQVEDFEYNDLLAREAAEREDERREIEAMFAEAQHQASTAAAATKKRGRPAKKKTEEDEEETDAAPSLGKPSLSTPQKSRVNLTAQQLQDIQDQMEIRITAGRNQNTAASDEYAEDMLEELAIIGDEEDDAMLQRVLLQQAGRNDRMEQSDADFAIEDPFDLRSSTRLASARAERKRTLGSRPGVVSTGTKRQQSLDGMETAYQTHGPGLGRKHAGPPRKGSAAASKGTNTSNAKRSRGIKPTRGTSGALRGRRTLEWETSTGSTPDPTTSAETQVPPSSSTSTLMIPVVNVGPSTLGTEQGPKPRPQSHTPIPLPSYIAGARPCTKPDSPPAAAAGQGRDESAQESIVAADPQDQEWEVKELEGVKVVEQDGEKVRYFKVRWEGDWPPDQNPSWEPEDCIDRAIVKAYLRKRRDRKKAAQQRSDTGPTAAVGSGGGGGGGGGKQLQDTLLAWLQPASFSVPQFNDGAAHDRDPVDKPASLTTLPTMPGRVADNGGHE